MVCARCSNQIPDDSRFCAHCGAQSLENQTTLRTPAETSSDDSAPPTTLPVNPRIDNLIGRTIDKRYRIDARLGTGGMGAVYRATRLLIGDEVAIKILRSEISAEPHALERFRREAQAAARLKHPNVVTIYDFGVTDDQMAYLVMELVEGETLRNLIRRNRALDQTTVTEIATQICAALDEAHRLNIVHRDLKPDNIIVNRGARGLVIKVLDFGIAKLRDAQASAGPLTETGVMMGTPHYMSPEQCMGEELDGRSDIYSLAVMLYEMLSGTVPFDAPSLTAIVLQQVTNPPPPMRSNNVSPAVESVVMRALAKRREARPQTASALAQELVAAVYGGQTKPVDRGSQTAWPGKRASSGPARAMPDTVPIHTPATPMNVMNVQARGDGRSKLVPLVIALSVAVVLVTGVVIYLLVSRKDVSQSNSNRTTTNRNASANNNAVVNRNISRPANNNTVAQTGSLSKFIGTWSEKWASIDNRNAITIMGTDARPIVIMGNWRVWDERLIGSDILTFRIKGGGSNWEFLYTAFYSSPNKLNLIVHRIHDNQKFTGELYR